MKKIVMGLVILLSTLSAIAQDNIIIGCRFNYDNVVKLSFGPGLFHQTFDFNNGQDDDVSLSLDLSVDYNHIFNNHMGVGVNIMNSYINALDGNDFYAGASFYFGALEYHTHKWYFDGSLGLGYAHNNYTEHKNGLGLLIQVGAHYKISRFWGIGAEVHSLNCFYKKPDDWKSYSNKGSDFFNSARFSLALGVQHFF
jgi:hypothetical protein